MSVQLYEKDKNIRILKTQLSNIALDIRSSNSQHNSLDQPIFSMNYEFSDGNTSYKRKKIILQAPGCTAATCTMCPIPNDALYKKNVDFKPSNFINQFNSAFIGEEIDDYQLISVYNSGNWFTDKEIPAEVRQFIYTKIANSKCEGIMVESLPQFITPKAIKEAKTNLKDKKLIVGIGLQSANDFVRNVCINTTCTKSQFEKASHLLWENGYIPKAYLMIKPPFLNEHEAVYEVISSINYASKVGYTDVTICPTRVSPNTVVYELEKQGSYSPPSLWTITEILKRYDSDCQVRVACLDMDSIDHETNYPQGCPQCTSRLLEALRIYNLDRDIDKLGTLNCSCKKDYEELPENINIDVITKRIQEFIENYHSSIK